MGFYDDLFSDLHHCNEELCEPYLESWIEMEFGLFNDESTARGGKESSDNYWEDLRIPESRVNEGMLAVSWGVLEFELNQYAFRVGDVNFVIVRVGVACVACAKVLKPAVKCCG